MTDDVESFVLRWRLKIDRHCLELRICRPWRSGRQWPAPLPELTLADGIRRVDEVQLVPDVRELEDFPEPCALRPGIARKIEYDGNAFRQDRADMWRDGVPQPQRAVEEPGHVGDFAGKEMLQELVLDEKEGGVVLGQFSRERAFPGRHLAAEKYERR